MRAIKVSVISILAIGLLAGSAVGVAGQNGTMVTGTAEYKVTETIPLPASPSVTDQYSGCSFNEGDANSVIISQRNVVIETSADTVHPSLAAA
jgi:hypothetical protein